MTSISNIPTVFIIWKGVVGNSYPFFTIYETMNISLFFWLWFNASMAYFIFIYYFFLRQSLTVQPRLALDLQQSFGFSLLSADLAGIHHCTWCPAYLFKGYLSFCPIKLTSVSLHHFRILHLSILYHSSLSCVFPVPSPKSSHCPRSPGLFIGE